MAGKSQTFHAATSPEARDIKERINKWDLIKIKSLCTVKENSIKMKREPTIWENIFVNDTSDKGLSPKYMKDSYDSTPERQTIQLKMSKVPEQTLLQGRHTEGP